MHKVIVITLNGNAYQVDEIGYEALRGYLDHAKLQLEANPDLAEIMGLAAYLNIDVTFIRVAFVILTVMTKGVWAAVYFVMMFVIPHARTSEEHAEAQGLPFNAQEVVDQAKLHFKSNAEQWKRNWKGQRRRWRRRFAQQQREWQRTFPEMFWWPEGARNLPFCRKSACSSTPS